MINNSKLEDICTKLQTVYEEGKLSEIRKAENDAYKIFLQLVRLQTSKLAFSSDEIRQYVISDAVTRCMIAVKKFKLYLENTFLGLTADNEIIGYSKKDKNVRVTYPLSVCYMNDHSRIDASNVGTLREGDTIMLKNNCFSFFSSTILNCCSTSIKTYKKCADVSLTAFEEGNNK